MISEQTYRTLLREKLENRTALTMRVLTLDREINGLMEEWARRERQEQRQTKGR